MVTERKTGRDIKAVSYIQYLSDRQTAGVHQGVILLPSSSQTTLPAYKKGAHTTWFYSTKMNKLQRHTSNQSKLRSWGLIILFIYLFCFIIIIIILEMTHTGTTNLKDSL